MDYLNILFLSMMPVTELRGAIPIGIAMNLDSLGVYIASVVGSSLVAIPLILTFRHILNFIREIFEEYSSKNRQQDKIIYEEAKECICFRAYSICRCSSSNYRNVDSCSNCVYTSHENKERIFGNCSWKYDGWCNCNRYFYAYNIS